MGKGHQVSRVIILVVFMLFSGNCLASDFDDGISIEDDKISNYDSIEPDNNLRFISQSAIGKTKIAKIKTKNDLNIGAMNSVIVEAGSDFKGNIYLIDQSKGDKTQVVGD